MPNRLFQQGKSAIYAHVGGPNKRYKTREDYIATWGIFSRFCAGEEIYCKESLTRSIIEDFIEMSSTKSASTQHNYLSRISNVVARLRPDINIPTAKELGIPNRKYGRTQPIPEHEDVTRLLNYLDDTRQWRFKLIVELAYWGGLRRRETMLLPLYQARKRMNLGLDLEVRFGTKGGAGHSVERNVPSNPELSKALTESTYYELEENLIPGHLTRAQYSNIVSNSLLPILKKFNVQKLHDLRSAYACRRYEQLLGVKAPICGGIVPKSSNDRDSLLKKLSRELGHGRIQVITSYVGSFKVPEVLGYE